MTVGYAAGATELLAAHRVHACCDVVLALRAVAGRARFVYPPEGGLVADARLTPREADVLVLLLGGLSTADVAARLCVASATARSHCRALLRKFGAPDRRALRARLMGAQSGAFEPAGGTPFGALR
jgi:DNA-binding CsgD family transcriptional regulator